MSLKVYLAGSIVEKEDIRVKRLELQKIGIGCTSQWLDANDTGDPIGNPSLCYYRANMDLEDIDKSDLTIMILGGKLSPGKFTEFGYCIANKKTVFLVGEPNSVFQFRKGVVVFDTWESCVKTLTESKRLLESIL